MEQDCSDHTWPAKVPVKGPQDSSGTPCPGSSMSSAETAQPLSPQSFTAMYLCLDGLHWGHSCLLLLQLPSWIPQTSGTSSDSHWTPQGAAAPTKASLPGAVGLCPEQGQHYGHLWLPACLPAWNSPILRFQPQKSPGSSWAWRQGGLRQTKAVCTSRGTPGITSRGVWLCSHLLPWHCGAQEIRTRCWTEPSPECPGGQQGWLERSGSSTFLCRGWKAGEACPGRCSAG